MSELESIKLTFEYNKFRYENGNTSLVNTIIKVNEDFKRSQLFLPDSLDLLHEIRKYMRSLTSENVVC